MYCNTRKNENVDTNGSIPRVSELRSGCVRCCRVMFGIAGHCKARKNENATIDGNALFGKVTLERIVQEIL